MIPVSTYPSIYQQPQLRNVTGIDGIRNGLEINELGLLVYDGINNKEGTNGK